MAASCFDLSTDSVEDFDLASTSAHLSEPSPSSPSSAWSESSRHEEVPVASTGDFAKRPSVGTWLLSKPRVQEEASHASGSGSNMASIQLEALEGEANMLARELAAIARKWHELVEDESRFKIESSQAAIEKERLQERLARLRAVMRRLQGRACEAAPAELPRAATRLGTAGESAKLCKRAKLLHQLPRLLLRAEQFDMDEAFFDFFGMIINGFMTSKGPPKPAFWRGMLMEKTQEEKPRLMSGPGGRDDADGSKVLDPEVFVSMNRFTVAPGREAEFEQRWAKRESKLQDMPGFRFFQLMRRDQTPDDEVNYISMAAWDNREAFDNWRNGDGFKKAHGGGGKPPQAGSGHGGSSRGGGGPMGGVLVRPPRPYFYEGKLVLESEQGA